MLSCNRKIDLCTCCASFKVMKTNYTYIAKLMAIFLLLHYYLKLYYTVFYFFLLFFFSRYLLIWHTLDYIPRGMTFLIYQKNLWAIAFASNTLCHISGIWNSWQKTLCWLGLGYHKVCGKMTPHKTTSDWEFGIPACV